jgi:putative endopeptidase
MSAPTRAQARLKLSKIMVKVGYPDHWRDYANLTIRADDLVGNVMRADAFDYAVRRSASVRPIDRDEWV